MTLRHFCWLAAGLGAVILCRFSGHAEAAGSSDVAAMEKISRYDRLPHLFKQDIERRSKTIEVEITGVRENIAVGQRALIDHWSGLFEGLIRSAVAKQNHLDRDLFVAIHHIKPRDVIRMMHDHAVSLEGHLVQFKIDDGRVYHFYEGGGHSGYVRGTLTVLGPKRLFVGRSVIIERLPFIASAVFPGPKSPYGMSEAALIHLGADDVRSQYQASLHHERVVGDGETLRCAKQFIGE